ncbi:hypothetical protein GXW82_42405 [Streptacidiphilus sp. 4-A2]|nr:hypothetical protein [Streptacidiphilus sp. 4-A2]
MQRRLVHHRVVRRDLGPAHRTRQRRSAWSLAAISPALTAAPGSAEASTSSVLTCRADSSTRTARGG